MYMQLAYVSKVYMASDARLKMVKLKLFGIWLNVKLGNKAQLSNKITNKRNVWSTEGVNIYAP